MPAQFLHGIEILQLDDGVRPIRTLKSSTIGIVGTAPNADADKFPLNTPVLIAGSRTEAAFLDTLDTGLGTLPAAMDDIFDQAGAAIVVIRVEEDADPATTKANIIGGVNGGTGAYEGLQALLAAEGELGIRPRIIVVPGFSDDQAVAAEMIVIMDRLRAVGFADGPNTTDAAAQTYRGNFGSKRLMIIDPGVKVFDPIAEAEVVRPASARFAGILARTDSERGFWHSPSNQLINGITGTARAIDFTLGDFNSRANLLNENEVTTIIRENGYRTWGNRTCSDDPKWAFMHVVRTADLIEDSIQRAHLWAVDRNITKTYIKDVTEGIKAYMRELKALGAIIDGDVWVDTDLNTAITLAAGKVYFDFDFSVPAVAEHITFRSRLTNKYLVQVLEA